MVTSYNLWAGNGTGLFSQVNISEKVSEEKQEKWGSGGT